MDNKTKILSLHSNLDRDFLKYEWAQRPEYIDGYEVKVMEDNFEKGRFNLLINGLISHSCNKPQLRKILREWAADERYIWHNKEENRGPWLFKK